MGIILLIFSLALIILSQENPSFVAQPPAKFNRKDIPGLFDFMKGKEYFSTTKKLNYNDKCSYKDEKLRISVVTQFLNLLNEDEKSKNDDDHFVEDITTLVNAGPLCNMDKNLQCGPNGKCMCLRSEYFGNVFPFKLVREENECSGGVGSFCFPQDKNDYEVKCQRDSHCVFKNSKSNCTDEKMVERLIDGYGGEHKIDDDLIGFLKYTQEMIWKKGMCVCSVPTIDDEEESSSSSTFTWPILVVLFITIGILIHKFRNNISSALAKGDASGGNWDVK